MLATVLANLVTYAILTTLLNQLRRRHVRPLVRYNIAIALAVVLVVLEVLIIT